MRRVSICTCVWRYPNIFIESKQTVEERKLALTDQVSFVLAHPYYLTFIHSISQNVLLPFLFPFYLFQAFHWSTDFPSFTYLLSPRAIVTILLQSLLHAQHFFGNYLAPARTGQSSKCWRGQSSEIASAILARYVRISATFAIGKPYSADEINRSRRLLRNTFDLSRVDRYFSSVIFC